MPASAPWSRELLARRVGIGIGAGIVAVGGLHAVLGLGGRALDEPLRDWATSVMYVIVGAIVWLRAVRERGRRAPWIALAIGISLYGAGNVLWTSWLEHVSNPPIPSVCDALWLSLYPFAYFGVAGLAGIRRGVLPAGVWLDAVVAGLGIAALGATVVLPPVLRSASGSPIAMATELAYPVCDLLLAALVLGLLALRGWRIDRLWGLLGGSFLTLAVADSMYAVQVAHGAAANTSGVANLFYMPAMLRLALAAGERNAPDSTPALQSWSVLVIPAAFTAGAIGLLAYGQVTPLGPLPYTLALLTLLAAVARTAMTFREVRALAETRVQAHTDELTSLANRRQLVRSAQEAVAASREAGASVAVMLIDLDDFKEINDTLGHHAGDVLLSQIGPRLEAALPRSDIVGRLGGDEFCVILERADAAAALGVARDMMAAFAAPFAVEGLSLMVSASIGISLFPAHADNAADLLRCADAAMYQAKRTRSGPRLYASDDAADPSERLSLAAELSVAFDGDQLDVHYQPQVDGHTGRVVGAEALVRWRHPTRGLLAPADFVGVAQRAGLVRELTRSVLAVGLEQLSRWRAEGHNLRLSVNVSAADLLDVGFPDELKAALLAGEVPPSALVLEVSQRTIADDPGRVGNALARLGELGIGLSLDDFGHGFTSLASLRTIPVGEIKLHRSIVRGITGDRVDAAIARSTMAIGRELGLRMLAVGVEDRATADAVLAAGCDVLQGYLVGPPVPAGDFGLVLRSGRAREQQAA